MVSQVLESKVAQTVSGLGYDLVELSRLGGGLLRVTIDTAWEFDGAQTSSSSSSTSTSTSSSTSPSATPSIPRSITVDDCERVTRQLQYLFEVENVDYQRLEVSSPGMDRRLRQLRDLFRFEGSVVDIVLRPVEGSPPGGRRKYRGVLHRHQSHESFESRQESCQESRHDVGVSAPDIAVSSDTTVVADIAPMSGATAHGMNANGMHTQTTAVVQDVHSEPEMLWEVQWQEAVDHGRRPQAKPGRAGSRVSTKAAANAPVQRVAFAWREVLEARLASVADFRRRAIAPSDRSFGSV